jgi:hypothetical protein
VRPRRDMDLVLFVSALFFIPAGVVAAIAAAVMSWLGIKGGIRLLCISLAVAAAISPVMAAAGHGAMPLPLVVLLGEHIFSTGAAGARFGDVLKDGASFYLVGVLVLAPLIALLLHLFFRRWAYDGR